MTNLSRHIAQKCFLLLAALWLSSTAFSQSGYTLYGFEYVPQSNHLNPAFRPDAKMVIGIPFLSSLSISAYSTSFSFNDLFIESGDSLYFDLEPVINQAGDNNYISGIFDMDIIYFGYTIKKGFLTVGIRQRVNVRAFYATDLMKLTWYGNNPYVGQEMDLSPTWVNTDHFNSWYAGYAFPVGKNVELGFRMNINQGISNIQTSRSNLKLLTDESDTSVYAMYAQTDYLVNTSNMTSQSSFGNYFADFNNIGMSVDLGATFRVGGHFKINLSFLDLGFLTWQSDLKSYEGTYDKVYFSGIYADPNDKDQDIFQVYSDSLKVLFEPKEFSAPYTSTLPARMMLGAEYYFNDEKSRASFLFSGRMLHGYFEPSFSLGYDMKVSDVFAFKASYTYLRYSPFNIGIGLVVDARPFQFYFMTDNVIAPFNIFGTQYLNFHFGFNLVWPRHNKK